MGFLRMSFRRCVAAFHVSRFLATPLYNPTPPAHHPCTPRVCVYFTNCTCGMRWASQTCNIGIGSCWGSWICRYVCRGILCRCCPGGCGRVDLFISAFPCRILSMGSAIWRGGSTFDLESYEGTKPLVISGERHSHRKEIGNSLV